MKKMQMMIPYLHYDLLKIIMFFVVKSSGGGADLARTISVCRVFMKFADDEDLLRAANFDNLELSDHYESYQCINGLINKCAQAGNVSAQYVLAKIILATTSQLWEKASKDLAYSFSPCLPIYQASSSRVTEIDTRAAFMAHFMADQASTSNRSVGRLIHSELVRLFVCRCNLVDLVAMRSHLDHYFRYFVGTGKFLPFEFISNINAMFGILRAVVDLVKNRYPWYSSGILQGVPIESRKGKGKGEYEMIAVGERAFHFLFRHRKLTFPDAILEEIHTPSDSRLEELKWECKIIDGELNPLELGTGERENDVKFIDLGERFFEYILERKLIDKEAGILDASFFRNWEYIRRVMKEAGKEYEAYRLDATLAFDEIFPQKDGF